MTCSFSWWGSLDYLMRLNLCIPYFTTTTTTTTTTTSSIPLLQVNFTFTIFRTYWAVLHINSVSLFLGRGISAIRSHSKLDQIIPTKQTHARLPHWFLKLSHISRTMYEWPCWIPKPYRQLYRVPKCDVIISQTFPFRPTPSWDKNCCCKNVCKITNR